MKHIYVNFKRFDVPFALGGVNRLAAIWDWGACIVQSTQTGLEKYADQAAFTMFFPEAHLIPALLARAENSRLQIGCQAVHREDITPGGNFGAMTACRPAAAMKALGCQSALIGHCEERREKLGVLLEAGVSDPAAVNRLLNREVLCAQAQGMDVLYCVGENSDETDRWEQVLGEQLALGLSDADPSRTVIAYEPIWSIGPGKTPASRAHIQMIARFLKQKSQALLGVPLKAVYGGGLKKDNAAMLAAIPEIDGGLIALTRFSGDIGFYPEEYLDIIRLYMEGANGNETGV